MACQQDSGIHETGTLHSTSLTGPADLRTGMAHSGPVTVGPSAGEQTGFAWADDDGVNRHPS